MLNLAVVGYGYWGPNIVRNFSGTGKAKVSVVCDLNSEVLQKARRHSPTVATIASYKEAIQFSGVDAVAVVTPVFHHYEIAKFALECGKHVFIEKPFTATVEQAEDLIELAAKKNLTIMVDHTFLFTGAVRKMKTLISDDNVLGDIYYYDSTRVNLGLFQHDVNVIWDLAPHDFSIMDYVIGKQPLAVAATGFDHFKRSLENTAYITVYFDQMIAHFNVNWLSPVKIRQTLVGGSKKMLIWDDLAADEKIKVYDRGVEVKTREGIYQLIMDYRSGDIFIPRVDQTEALLTEANYFVDCINTGKKPINDGEAGLRVVKLLQKADESLKARGREIQIR